jgi:hypothetical protein
MQNGSFSSLEMPDGTLSLGFRDYLLGDESLSFGQLRLKAVSRQTQMAQH